MQIIILSPRESFKRNLLKYSLYAGNEANASRTRWVKHALAYARSLFKTDEEARKRERTIRMRSKCSTTGSPRAIAENLKHLPLKDRIAPREWESRQNARTRGKRERVRERGKETEVRSCEDILKDRTIFKSLSNFNVAKSFHRRIKRYSTAERNSDFLPQRRTVDAVWNLHTRLLADRWSVGLGGLYLHRPGKRNNNGRSSTRARTWSL